MVHCQNFEKGVQNTWLVILSCDQDIIGRQKCLYSPAKQAENFRRDFAFPQHVTHLPHVWDLLLAQHRYWYKRAPI